MMRLIRLVFIILFSLALYGCLSDLATIDTICDTGRQSNVSVVVSNLTDNDMDYSFVVRDYQLIREADSTYTYSEMPATESFHYNKLPSGVICSDRVNPVRYIDPQEGVVASYNEIVYHGSLEIAFDTELDTDSYITAIDLKLNVNGKDVIIAGLSSGIAEYEAPVVQYDFLYLSKIYREALPGVSSDGYGTYTTGIYTVGYGIREPVPNGAHLLVKVYAEDNITIDKNRYWR